MRKAIEKYFGSLKKLISLLLIMKAIYISHLNFRDNVMKLEYWNAVSKASWKVAEKGSGV